MNPLKEIQWSEIKTGRQYLFWTGTRWEIGRGLVRVRDRTTKIFLSLSEGLNYSERMVKAFYELEMP